MEIARLKATIAEVVVLDPISSARSIPRYMERRMRYPCRD